MSRLTIKELVTKDLHYCCIWAFFRLYTDPALIAARLGVSDRAVRSARAKAREAGCQSCPRCLRKRGISRLQPPEDSAAKQALARPPRREPSTE